ncbi:MAG: hypothetical protein CL897_05095 [Dehalococcoidia bacterium]|nr:hypothetical protein [Dehalococcoidia bacterium]HCU99983.1 hypothetical protein [Dehalococcoidia bacterium]|tara:strand:- start:195 stop:1196 length:1002 start_codon:yes stop_codon:yes gene_type:complete
MTRRDRTTGLPDARRSGRTTSANEGRGLLAQRITRFAIIGTAVAALLVVAGLLIYSWYDSSIATPGKVVLSVGNEEFSLSYYSARLPEFSRTDPSGGSLLVTQALLNKLEQEGLTITAATGRGIPFENEEITALIALELGVAADTSRGSLFDIRYRDALRNSGMSEGQYRQYAKARLAARELEALLRKEIGETGAIIEIRFVTTATLAEAIAVKERIDNGEDMGTIAQLESLYETSRQNDGLLITPPELLLEALQEALVEAKEMETLDPVEAEAVFWVMRLEGRDPEGTYTPEHIAGLGKLLLDDVVEEERSRVKIERNLTTDDANWALEQAD